MYFVKPTKRNTKKLELCKMELFCNIVLKDNMRELAHKYLPHYKSN